MVRTSERLTTVSLVLLSFNGVVGIDNGLGLTPPMGWRSWNLFGENVDQSLLTSIMDGMVARKRQVDGFPKSLCDLGYCDVGLDDNWQACGKGEDGYQYHDHLGQPIVNLDRFPNMKNMTDYAHGLGLTAGWYGNNCICSESKQPTDQMYEQDVRFLTEVFQFDAVKLDGCGKQLDLDKWSSLINASGRKVMIENCHWGNTVPNATWCPWNFFRTSGDVRAAYGSVVSNLQTTVQWAQKGLSKPGCWGYPDMLEVGCKHGPGGASDKGLSFVEARSHFGAWCIVSSPLTLSHDVNNDTIMDEVWPIISNTEAIAINQAWAGHSGSPFKEGPEIVTLPWGEEKGTPSWQFFYKPLPGAKVAVLMMNHADTTQTLSLDFQDIPGLPCQASCKLRDVWNHVDLGVIKEGHYEKSVESHDSVFLVLSAASADEKEEVVVV
mmetsp:Transcript_62276/g.131662  ORF Transcript_62276/g.131662 Transcript_62276/m.131662 type:complete len:436 (+) Transcript_62276:88-1395(+)